VLDVAKNKVTVQSRRSGGAFGAKFSRNIPNAVAGKLLVGGEGGKGDWEY